jgi:hypothetical protein
MEVSNECADVRVHLRAVKALLNSIHVSTANCNVPLILRSICRIIS